MQTGERNRRDYVKYIQVCMKVTILNIHAVNDNNYRDTTAGEIENVAQHFQLNNIISTAFIILLQLSGLSPHNYM